VQGVAQVNIGGQEREIQVNRCNKMQDTDYQSASTTNYFKVLTGFSNRKYQTREQNINSFSR
jgi:hypothetical protein